MKLNRPLVIVAYAMVLLMILIPIGEALLSVAPFRLGDTAWRFGAAGMVSRALMTPLLGLILLGAIGYALERRWVVLTTAGLALFAMLALFGAQVIFILDAVQMRSLVREEARQAFDAASVLALFKMFVSGVVTLLLAIGAWRMARAARKAPASARRAPSSLVVGRKHETEDSGSVVAAAPPTE